MIQITRPLIGTHTAKVSQYGLYRLRMTALMLLADMAGLVLAILFGHLITADRFSFLFFDPGKVITSRAIPLCLAQKLFGLLHRLISQGL